MVLDGFNSTLPVNPYLDNYVLYGIDGSGLNFFQSEWSRYLQSQGGKSKLGNNEIHVVASYRLTDHIFTDAVIQPRKKKNEYSAVCDIINNCTFDGGIPIFLADRGFPSYNMFAHAKEKDVFFLVRAKDLYIEQLLRNDLLLIFSCVSTFWKILLSTLVLSLMFSFSFQFMAPLWI